MSPTTPPKLDVDLKAGVYPISKAASSSAQLLKRSRATQSPMIVTQKGYPAGVLLDIELFVQLRQFAELALAQGANPGDAGYSSEADLKAGVYPISKVASAFAALIKRSRATKRPIIVTQKGYPAGVLLDIELYLWLKALADLVTPIGVETAGTSEREVGQQAAVAA